MPRGVSDKVVFKAYDQHQMTFLPPSLDELIPANHLVRLVSSAIDRMNLDAVMSSYPGGGASHYHPRMLLKVLVYGYTQRLYSSRRLAKAIRENIHFMWLAGGNRPDFRTLNRFRSSQLKSTIDDVFVALSELLLEAGLIRLEDYFLDGTKLEANANKYSFVWKKSTKKYQAQMQKQLRQLLVEIDAANDLENRAYGDHDLEEVGEDSEPLSSDRIAAKLKEVEERLSRSDDDDDDPPSGADNRTLKKAAKKIRDDFLPRQQKYEDYEDKLGDRNSFSKTDPDATFMRLKDDHMRNGQLKAAYNLQMGTEDQFIVGFSVHQHPTDTGQMIPHFEHVQALYGRFPEQVTADAGYGSEENYSYLNNNGIIPYVKYNNFHVEQKRAFKQNRFRTENLDYDEETDSYTCPNNKKLTYVETKPYRTQNGYTTNRRIYQCESCDGCELRPQCHKAKGDRSIQVSPELNRYKEQARELLMSPEGKRQRSRRPVEVEAVFGQIKQNDHFKRFLLRGLLKVHTEFGLIAIAHNIKKWWKAEHAIPVTT